MKTAMEVARLAMMLSSDEPGRSLDVMYIPGLTEGMVSHCGLFDEVAVRYASGKIGCVAFNGSDGEVAHNKNPGSGWPGKEWYRKELARRGIPQSVLVPTGPGLHTRDETDKFVLAAKEHGWKSAGCATVAYHYPRVFSCLVKSMQTVGFWLPVWALVPRSTDWYSPMLGSQGESMTNSFEAAIDDATKVLTYIERGFGADFPDIYKYLKAR